MKLEELAKGVVVEGIGPDFHVYSVNYKLEKLLEGAEPPS
jgi:hypothetical protein